jgi:hypothetical protein
MQLPLFIIVFTLLHGLHHNLLDYCNYLMVQSYLWHMVHTRANGDDVLDVPEGSTAHGHGRGQSSHGNAPPPLPCPSVSVEQLLAMQNELMTLLIQNKTHHGGRRATTPLMPGHEHVLIEVPVNSPITILWGKGPARGRRLAPHH